MTKSKVAIIKKGKPISNVRLSIFNGPIKAGTPTTNKRLNTFEPNILPKATSYFFFEHALTETTSSGNEVQSQQL